MTPNEYLQELLKVNGPAEAMLSPGPFKIRVSKDDAIAARLIMWLLDQSPDDVTYGQLEDVLDSAKWWLMFFAALVRLEDDGADTVAAIEEFLKGLTEDSNDAEHS